MENLSIDEAIQQATRGVDIDQLKKEQHQAIAAFVGGSDVFVVLPTGYGKSLCYGLLPRVLEVLRDDLWFWWCHHCWH